jgi:hypothetical protein
MDDWSTLIVGLELLGMLSWWLQRVGRTRTPPEVRRVARERRKAPDPDRWARLHRWALWDLRWFD